MTRAREELTTPGAVVKKDNRLIRTRVSISSVDAARILANLVACIRQDDTQFKSSYSVAVKDFLGDTSGRGYIRIKGIAKELTQAFAELEAVDEDGELELKMRPFFTEIGYKRGVISARFNPTLGPYLLNLKACFTQINLLEYIRLPSIYSQRLFEILKSFEQLPEAAVSLAELHRLLDTPMSFRANFFEFRRRVLEKAHDDILRHTSMRYSWTPIKAGKSVESVRFVFGNTKSLPTAKEELDQAKAEKARRLRNKRFVAAVECARGKGGDCRTQDNARLVCKVCREAAVCATVAVDMTGA